VQIGNLSSSALGISNIDVTTPVGQAAALSSVSNALAQVNAQNSNIGSTVNSLNSTLANQNTTYDNLAAANSQVSNTDYAAASTELSQAKVQSQVALQATAMYNSMQSNVLELLPK
jgi:flagellin